MVLKEQRIIMLKIEMQLMDQDATLATLKSHLEMACNRMKKQADRKRREVEFVEGDSVFLKIHPYRQQSVAHCRNAKVAPRFFCPFQISQRIGLEAYRLDLTPESSIHNVFHVYQLKKLIGDH